MFADGTAEARVAARYADFDPQEMHRMQIESNSRREHYVINNGVRYDVPQVPAPAVIPATEAQINYLVNLSAAKTPWVAQPAIIDWARTAGKFNVSAKISELKAMRNAVQDTPATGALERHGVPAGRYAVDGAEGQTVFVKVDRPTEGQWADRIFVKVQAGSDLHRIPRGTADALLGKIATAGVQEAMLRYGREIGSCGHCGRVLTNEESRQSGIGPTCRSKLGW